MKISELLPELSKRNRLLYVVGLVHAILFLTFAILYFFDDRQVSNINLWIKPMKFAASITIYVWTVAWIIPYIQNVTFARWIAVLVAISMIAEMVTIGFQAGRGVASHFNVTSAFNGVVFAIMGLFIGLNTLTNLALFFAFLGPTLQLDQPAKAAWIAGLLLLCLGSYSGILMVVRLAHTVGAPDGGPGLPFVNWSTSAGDIRVAHFFTLHGFQVIPLLWWIVSDQLHLTKRTWVVVGISLLYFSLCVGLHVMAMEGHALIAYP